MPRKQKKKLTDYSVDPRNINLGTERGNQAHEASIQANGLGRSILVSNDRIILAGNKTFEKAGEVGVVDDIVEVDVKGNTLVVVRRVDLQSDSPEALAMALADNAVSEKNYNPDKAKLATYLSSLLADRGVEGAGYTQAELTTLLASSEALRLSDKTGGGGGGGGGGGSPLPESGVRQVLLFFNAETHPLFIQRTRELFEHFNVDNITDVVFQAIKNAHETRTTVPV